MVRVAALQFCGAAHVADNLEIIAKLVADAANAGANWVCLPECSNLMGAGGRALHQRAEAAETALSVKTLSELAKHYQITLFAGSLLLRETGANKLVNRSFVFSPEGSCLAHYDKIHMFDADVGDGVRYAESDHFEAGNKVITVKCDEATAGLSICYDLRFPHLYRTLAQAGADVLMIPAAFTYNSGKAHWHILQRARAIETGSFVIAAAQVGTHEDGRQTYGNALIISPRGEILADGGADTSPHFIMADLDLSEVHRARRAMTAWTHNPEFTVR